jgi:hypothetical protein
MVRKKKSRAGLDDISWGGKEGEKEKEREKKEKANLFLSSLSLD